MPKNSPDKASALFKVGDGFQPTIGQRVTAKSIPARIFFLDRPKTIELANYPSLIGVPLTIVAIEDWIVCTRPSGSYAPGLTAEDLELWEGEGKHTPE